MLSSVPLRPAAACACAPRRIRCDSVGPASRRTPVASTRSSATSPGRRRVAVGSFLSDLKPGDHVVHEEHGIARFEQFVTKEVAGVVREYLELRFAGTDVVALPTERVDRVTRYVGGTPPALSALGGRE